MNKIVILSGGGHAKSVINLLLKIKKYRIIGYTDINNRGKIEHIDYLGNDKVLEDLIKRTKFSAIGYSYVGKNTLDKKRKNIIKYAKDIGFNFPKICSPNSVINQNVIIGEGSYIFDSVMINYGVRIGDYCIINTGVIIEHNVVINNHVQIASGTILCGDVKIHENVFIGAGAIIRDGIEICSNVIIGMGSSVTKSISEPGIYFGNPLKKISDVQ